MATASSELSSTPRWALSRLGQFVGGFVVMGLVFLAFGSFSFYVVGLVYADALPFLWLVILSYTITINGWNPSDRDQEAVGQMLEHVVDMSRLDRWIYVATLLLLVIGGVTIPIAVIGTLSALVAFNTAVPVVSVVIAFLLPPIDAWLGRERGVSLGALGFVMALYFMKAIAFVYHASPDVPDQASDDFRSALI